MSEARQEITIEVTGDLIRDSNLAQLPLESCTYSNPVQATSRRPRNGGAWYLADLVTLSCSDLQKDFKPISPPSPVKGKNESYAQAHTVWSVFAEIQEKKNKNFVWRIREFLGCQKPSDAAPSLDAGTCADVPEMIVIDDANLGFRDDERRWPVAIRDYDEDGKLEVGKNLKIVLKHSPSLAQGALWKHLIENYADQLTVVISLTALRDRHAVISKGISWDQTIEDLIEEFSNGISAYDLGQAVNVIVHIPGAGVACFSREDPKKKEKLTETQLRYLVFDPDHMEDDWKQLYPGSTFGAGSILTAAMVRHLQQPGSYPFFIAASRAISAIRKNHAIGAGKYDQKSSDDPFNNFDTDAAHGAIKAILHPVKDSKPKPVYAENDYAAVLTDAKDCLLNCQTEQTSKRHSKPGVISSCEIDLLQDVTGYNEGFLSAKALEIVRDGVDVALRSVPKAKYGNFVTVDREEIERINELRSLIEEYCNNPADRKPLSLAVFGPPGSGKSFAIKQLAKQLFPKNRTPLEFNLSQFADQHELNEAFHQVHNSTVRGEIPFVFWDEFDTEKLDWLKSFLAPMQDAVFRDAGIEHPFGKAIFIFAGGTCESFEEFNQLADKDVAGKPTFKELKGPDFVSRLRGYLNVKGPNQIQDKAKKRCLEKSEHVYLIRRAMLLRSLLERNAPQIINQATKMASISTGIINAFIHVKEYHHGARSMESVITMGTLRGKNYYGPNALPSPRLLALHVTEDFWKEKITAGELSEDVMELMAKVGFEAWREDKKRQGYVYDKERNDDPKKGALTHPQIKDYEELTENEKQGNRNPVPRRILDLKSKDYRLKKTHQTIEDEQKIQFTDKTRKDFLDHEELLNGLMELEHQVWLRSHLVNGWEKSTETIDKLRLHTDIQAFKDLEDKQKETNRAIITNTIEELQEAGYLIEKK